MPDLVVRCKNCGAFLLRGRILEYKEGDAHMQIEVNCPRKRCRMVNIIDLHLTEPGKNILRN